MKYMPQELSLQDPKLDRKLAKSNKLEKIDFEASVERGVQSVFKKDDDFVIWGPASVEIVDKEGDKITADALDDALPQLLRRARLSLDHSDQIVGQILQEFKTEQPITVEIDGNSYEKQDFKTEVKSINDSPPALYVAGEIYNDTRQSKRARERVEEGELDSYSISGEALVTRKKVEDGVVYDDVVDMDLSAVTLCEEGMNQGAKYARVDGEVSSKETASISEKEENTISIDHPSSQSSSPDKNPVSKDMTDESITSGTKMDDVRDVAEKVAEETVDSRFPDANLATVDAVEQIVEQKMEEADVSWNSPESVSGVTEGTDEPQTTTGGEGSADTMMTTNENDVSVTSEKTVQEARDNLAEQLNVDKESVNNAIGSLLQQGDYEDEEEDEEEEMEMMDYEEDEDEEEDEMEMQDMDDDHDYEEDEMEDEMEDDGDTVSMSTLENDLPDDVWKVVQEYVKGDYEEDEEDEDEEMEMSTSNKSNTASELQEAVEGVLKGSTEASTGASVPSDGEQNQVDKQYAEPDSSVDDGESPALNNFY